MMRGMTIGPSTMQRSAVENFFIHKKNKILEKCSSKNICPKLNLQPMAFKSIFKIDRSDTGW